MRFKFFHKNSNITHTNELKRYHTSLLNVYRNRFNLYPGQEHYISGSLITNTVNYFIDEGQLTSYREIRAYYHAAYELLCGDDIITDEMHRGFIRSATWTTTILTMYPR
jgi:hypothetical protein